MKVSAVAVLGLVTLSAVLLYVMALAGDRPARTGPETEQRFPPLKVPPGFRATLFACDPLLEYPSAVALGPKPGSLFVAIDYLTGLGTEIVRRDEIRLLEDTDGDGYADKATVYATGFNSIQGLTYHDGAVYAMHAPLLTALRDVSGDGVADERHDLLTGLGLPPERNPPRLHCANGVVMGHDGWLYLALGDHGCDVPRLEGDRLVLDGGGILRCRANGRDLHVFATGLRNIYDVALDEELNVFVRDNENDGGDYKIRVCHSFFGADHGYPYLYYERPTEAVPPLADLGLGSSAGGLCYLETQFPPEYCGNLFFCEWGRAVMRYRPERAGSTFAPLREIEFAAGADNDPYGFKPTDLVVQRDGSLIVVDWADGQRPKRGRGRIYRIAYVGAASGPESTKPHWSPAERSLGGWIAQLDSTSYFDRTAAQAALEARGREGTVALLEALRNRQVGVRGRLHTVWALASVGGQACIGDLLNLARTDPDPRVQAQAVRAVADLTDPVLARHRLDAGPGDADLAARLAELARGRDPRVVLEVVLALGRLRWSNAPDWLRANLTKPDAVLAHAAMQTLRRSENWPALLKLLDEADGQPVRALALQALAGQAQPMVVDGLIDRLRTESDPGRRREYADAQTRVYKKPGPWVYWGYRPPPRLPNSVTWERTEAIERALDRVLADPDRSVRLAVLRRMQRERIPTRLETLGQWLRDEREPESVAALLESLREHHAAEVRPLLGAVVGEEKHTTANRLAALTLVAQGLDQGSEAWLLELAGSLEDGPVLAEALRQAGKRAQLKASPLLVRKSSAPDPVVRAAAVETLAELRVAEAGETVQKLLADADVRVRRAAAAAAGRLNVRSAIETLLTLARDADAGVRRGSLDSLRLLREPRAVPLAVAALTDRETEVAALQCLAELGGPGQAKAVVELATRNPSAEVLPLVVRLLTQWGGSLELPRPKQAELDRAVAEVQGASGNLVRWQAHGPLPMQAATPLIERFAHPEKPSEGLVRAAASWRTLFATGTESRLHLGSGKGLKPDSAWLAHTDVEVPEATTVQFLAAGTGQLRVWLNGRRIYQRDQIRAFQPDADRFEASLSKGLNRLLVAVVSPPQTAEFHLRFRRKSSTAEHERLTQAALARSGNAERGRKVFFNNEKSLCLKCHRIGDQGEPIGPELSGVGNRFSRIHLIESILQPSRTIAPSFETLAVALKDGRVLSGLRIAETETALTIGDNQGQKHVLAKADIEDRQPQAQSTMPDGLEKRLTEDEFVDLIAFLVSQK
jgi:putative membrane-bound dehydrogenase-like protein